MEINDFTLIFKLFNRKIKLIVLVINLIWNACMSNLIIKILLTLTQNKYSLKHADTLGATFTYFKLTIIIKMWLELWRKYIAWLQNILAGMLLESK